jgi:hypothetical protein
MLDKTRELALLLMRTYIIRKYALDGTYPNGLQEISLVSLSIASKLEEERLFTLKNVMIENGFYLKTFSGRTMQELTDLEIDIYKLLRWRLNLSTPIEMAKHLLYYANPTHDFTQILFQVSSYLFFCLLGKSLKMCTYM